MGCSTCGGSGARLTQRTAGVQKRSEGVEKNVDVIIATPKGILVLKPTVLVPFRFKLTAEISRTNGLPRHYSIDATVSEQPTDVINWLLSNAYSDLVDTVATKKANEPQSEPQPEPQSEPQPVVAKVEEVVEVVQPTVEKAGRKKATGV